ncbi:MAG: hypothetical protein ACM3H8_16710 [Sphingobacteriales bacterium]
MPSRLLVFVCAVITLAIFLLNKKLMDWGFDVVVLFAGNLILFIVTLISSYFHTKGAADKNPNAFVRSVYGGTMIKMFTVMIAVMVYAFTIKPFNKYSVIACLLFYVIYTVIEVRAAMKTVKASGK